MPIKKKRVAVFTAARSDYFILRPLIASLKADIRCDLLLIVSGMHMMNDFGATKDLITQDGHIVNAAIAMSNVTEDSPMAIATTMGQGMERFARTLSELAPDVCVLLGDRYEMMSFATTCYIMGIPLVHLHGGELTYGAFDDALRHCITKMASLHLASTEEYKARIIQMGEQPDTVFNTGALAVDNILGMETPERGDLVRNTGLPLESPYFLVTVHPETKGRADLEAQALMLLDALEDIPSHKIIWTSANADPLGKSINDKLRYEASKGRITFVDNLGKNYIPVLKYADAIIGNSSSGIIEAPILGTPTINLGTRQNGRVRTASILDCSFDAVEIRKALRTVLSRQFMDNNGHPYGKFPVAATMADVILTADLKHNPVKQFFDIAVAT